MTHARDALRPAPDTQAMMDASATGGGSPLSTLNLKRLSALIHDYSGIKMPASKRTMLEGRLRRRMRILGMTELDDYCDHLFDEGGLDEEIVHLIDAITTNKTDFFREPAQFDYLVQHFLPELAELGRRSIKVWSAAASIGAEAYSLAMVLEEHRLNGAGQDWSILATDLSTGVLTQGVIGIYPSAMMDPVPTELSRRYVLRARDAARAEMRIAPALRARVAFARMNLMDEAYPVARDMDMIFCRNVLIYFDKPTQEAVLRRLCDHLRPGARLFLGHSESVVGLDLPLALAANTVFRKV